MDMKSLNVFLKNSGHTWRGQGLKRGGQVTEQTFRFEMFCCLRAVALLRCKKGFSFCLFVK